MDNIDIIGIGALNMDNIYRVERILEEGEVVVDEAKSFPGGSAANTIYSLSKLGLNTGFVGAVGDDSEGVLLVKDFDKAGVDVRHIKVKEGIKTGSTLCLSDTFGKRAIYVAPGANNQLDKEDIDTSYINKADFLHISSFADEKQLWLLLDLIDTISTSLKISFSPGELFVARGFGALIPILKRVHVLFINHDEIKSLTNKGIIEGAAMCLEYGCQIIVITLGKGQKIAATHSTSATCYIRDKNIEYTIEPLADSGAAVDSTGAGDAFASGFLYGLISEKGLLECGNLGNIVARFCISKLGARQGLPTITQLSRRYFELYNRQL